MSQFRVVKRGNQFYPQHKVNSGDVRILGILLYAAGDSWRDFRYYSSETKDLATRKFNTQQEAVSYLEGQVPPVKDQSLEPETVVYEI